MVSNSLNPTKIKCSQTKICGAKGWRANQHVCLVRLICLLLSQASPYQRMARSEMPRQQLLLVSCRPPEPNTFWTPTSLVTLSSLIFRGWLPAEGRHLDFFQVRDLQGLHRYTVASVEKSCFLVLTLPFKFRL